MQAQEKNHTSKTSNYDALTRRQKLFVDYYLVSLNGTKAAVAAGYGEKNARIVASQNLAKLNIAAAVSERLADSPGITQARIVDELAKVAFANARDFFSFGPGGVTLKESSDMNEDQMACVASATEAPGKFGSSISIKLHDKLGALCALGRAVGLDKSKHEITGKNGERLVPEQRSTGVFVVPQVATPEEWQRLMRADQKRQREDDNAAIDAAKTLQRVK